MIVRMQQRRGSTAQWASANPTLASGEFGLDETTKVLKIGDGISAWDDLDEWTSKATLARLDTEVWQGARNLPNGPLLEPPTGQDTAILALPSGNVPEIISGEIASAYNLVSGVGAWYIQTELEDHVSRIGARWVIDGPASSTIGLIAWADDYGQHLLPSPVVPDSACHFVINTTGWTYSIVHSSGTFITAGSGTFPIPLVADGATVHTAEVTIDRENGTAYVDLPDGTTATVTHALIKTLSSKWACIEEYRGSPANTKIRVLEWWGDSGHSGEAVLEARVRARRSSAWNSPAMSSAWVNYGGALFPPFQWRYEGNNVRVRGSIKSGAITVGTTIYNFITAGAPAPTYLEYVATTEGGKLWVLGIGSGGDAGKLQYISGGNTQQTFDFMYPIG